MKRILIVDQQPVSRIGLGCLIQGLSQSVELHESDEAASAYSMLESKAYDAVIVDLDFGQSDGIGLIKRIHRLHGNLPILVFTAHPEHRYGVRALRAGAIGYVSKLGSKESVLLAVRRTLEGRHFISRELSERLAYQITGRVGTSGHESLSDREYQIASLIARGSSVSVIAGELSISVKTVHTHRSRALKKLGLRNNAELTHYAFRQGLVD